jgi:tetratricopeptide (TPR) repeat protein
MTSLHRAQVLMDLGRHAEARAELAVHLARQPDSVLGLCMLAHSELASDEPDAALAITARVVALAPEEEWPLRIRALALMRLRRFRDARAAAKAAVRADSDNWRTHYVRALVHAETADYEQAHAMARQAAELAPHEADVHVILGLSLAGMGRDDEARAAYQEALRLDPESARALNNLAAVDINSARLGRAARNVAAGLRLAPNEETLQQNLDMVVLRLSRRLLLLVVLGLLPIALVPAAADHAWWARAATGAVLACLYGVVVWTTLRHLPAGARRHLRGLPRRMPTAERVLGVMLVVLGTLSLFLAFAPAPAWDAVTRVLAVIVHNPHAQTMAALWVVAWISVRLRARRHH